MAIFILSLMVVLSTVEGQNSPQFKAFQQRLSDSKHGVGQLGGFQGFQGVSRLIQSNLPQPSATATAHSLNFKISGNIVEQTKAISESARILFKSLEDVTLVPQIFDHVFKTSDCLGNVQGAIELMNESEKIVVENGPEIIYLEAIVESLENEKNITKLITSSAKMLRILEILIPNLSAKYSKLCISSTEDSIENFRDLAHVLVDILNHRDINLPETSRLQVEFSSKVMSEVANFLVSMNKSLTTFETLCQGDNKKMVALYNSMGDIMESLAALYDVFGNEEKSKDIRKQGVFLEKIVDALRDIDELNSTLECGSNGGYETLAVTLEDLAEIVQSVGIEALSKELGFDLGFINES